MNEVKVCTGYLDVKISAKSRRGFTPWKAWHKQWCEIRRLDNIENGAELKLKTSQDGNVISCVVLPRSSTVCRIQSRSKSYAFGVFTCGRSQKPLLFLSGSCESDTQRWMEIIRKTLSIALYIPVGNLSFHVSIVDNTHSRAAGLTGLHGILSANCQEIIISDPTTGENIIKWKWHQFHQFHLQAVSQVEDENVICVFHTSREFIAGPGQLHFYCQKALNLLELLVSRGKCKFNLSLAASQRLSLSEGDLSKSTEDIANNPNYCLRNLSDSDDSGVQEGLLSGGSESHTKNSPSMTGLLSKTPGGSEADDDDDNDNEDVSIIDNSHTCKIPRGESGISLASGVYEEIPETLPDDKKNQKVNENVNIYTNGHMAHVYEDPEELSTAISFKCDPPPLPPRIFSRLEKNCDTIKDEDDNISIKSTSKVNSFIRNTYKYRSSTLPSKDLRRLSQTFTTDSDYMVMMMPKNKKDKAKTKTPLVPESLYVPMSPIVNNIKTKIESCYMVMSGKKC
ncbi:hypothetical protein ILUMI_05899 [Ignelater luminosus]|uniref:PH domain-containing protein n=1 Tax=Ignelater luminosus TaxID=2038154 RepID=A0A8K0D9M4_IGNLU|nr:hypothetical protein ILUMI_05899 [Ignelater luminosus]